MNEFVHISEGPMDFNGLKDYILYLDSIQKAGYIDSVVSVNWEQGKQVKAKLELKHTPNFMNLKVETEAEGKSVKIISPCETIQITR